MNKLTKEIINDKSLVVKDNVLYLYKAADDPSNDYMQMMLINGVAVELGSTQVDMSDYYSKTDSDNKFAAKLDLDTLTEAVEGLQKTSGKLIALNDTSTYIEEMKKLKVNATSLVYIANTVTKELGVNDGAAYARGVVSRPNENLIDFSVSYGSEQTTFYGRYDLTTNTMINIRRDGDLFISDKQYTCDELLSKLSQEYVNKKLLERVMSAQELLDAGCGDDGGGASCKYLIDYAAPDTCQTGESRGKAIDIANWNCIFASSTSTKPGVKKHYFEDKTHSQIAKELGIEVKEESIDKNVLKIVHFLIIIVQYIVNKK